MRWMSHAQMPQNAAMWRAVFLVFVCLSQPLRSAESDDTRNLIAWLLADGRDLKGIAFSEVLAAATGKKMIPVDATTDAAWLKRLGCALDRVLLALNDPAQAIHEAGRINEASRFIEDQIRAELSSEPGWLCAIPRTSSGTEQRSGYPDLRLVLENGAVVYLDPKLFDGDSRKSTLRTFYYEPKTTTGKVRDDARHLLVGIHHNGKTGADLRLLGWELMDVSRLRVQLKAEFQASNNDIYRAENIVGRSGQ